MTPEDSHLKGAEGREIRDQEGRLLQMGDPIPMYCAACGKPWRFDAASARFYVCSCGSTKATGTVIFRG